MTRIDPAVVQGTVLVDVELLTDDLPPNARPDLSVDGRIGSSSLRIRCISTNPAERSRSVGNGVVPVNSS